MVLEMTIIAASPFMSNFDICITHMHTLNLEHFMSMVKILCYALYLALLNAEAEVFLKKKKKKFLIGT